MFVQYRLEMYREKLLVRVEHTDDMRKEVFRLYLLSS
jgi:hypothetical protein